MVATAPALLQLPATFLKGFFALAVAVPAKVNTITSKNAETTPNAEGEHFFKFTALLNNFIQLNP
jgi:hypothetical protein